MSDVPFDGTIPDRKPDPVLEEIRRFAAEHREAAEGAISDAFEARLQTCVRMLDQFSDVLLVPLEHAELDLRARTRHSAIWPLAARSLGLGRAVLALIEAGYGVEAFPIARSIYECNRMVRAFSHPKGTELAKQWLDGKTPKPSSVAKTLQAIDADREGRELQSRLYRTLSGAGHVSRDSMDWSISHSTREATIGPTPDWGIRAYHLGRAEALIWEVCFCVGIVLTIGNGSAFYDDFVLPALDEFARLQEEHPFPDEHVRQGPIECPKRTEKRAPARVLVRAAARIPRAEHVTRRARR